MFPRHTGHTAIARAAPQYVQVVWSGLQSAPHDGQFIVPASARGFGTVRCVPHRHRARVPAGRPLTSYREWHVAHSIIIRSIFGRREAARNPEFCLAAAGGGQSART